MVGHTHEDIDQGFSCLARHLQKTDALTVSGLCIFYLFTFMYIVGTIYLIMIISILHNKIQGKHLYLYFIYLFSNGATIS